MEVESKGSFQSRKKRQVLWELELCTVTRVRAVDGKMVAGATTCRMDPGKSEITSLKTLQRNTETCWALGFNFLV